MDSTVVVAIIGAFISLMTLAYQIYKDRHQNKSAVSKAVGFLLLRELERQCNKLIAQGFAYRHEMRLLEDIYAIYHKLGNGYADTLMAQCRKLPLKED